MNVFSELGLLSFTQLPIDIKRAEYIILMVDENEPSERCRKSVRYKCSGSWKGFDLKLCFIPESALILDDNIIESL